MAKDCFLFDLPKKVSTALLDALTSVFCVAYWAGLWSMLDAYEVNQMISGGVASAVVFILAILAADQCLEDRIQTWHPVLQAIAIWCWTCCLAVFSLMIWRACWWSIQKLIFDPDGLKAEAELFGTLGKNHISYVNAVLLVVLGASVLTASGRFRSSSHAPPVGVVVDCPVTGNRFAQASFSGGRVENTLIDFALTLFVVFVWFGIWKCFDNLKVHVLLSAILCNGVIAACAIWEIDAHLRRAFDGFSTMAHNIADFAFTSILAFLAVGVWRGVWGAIDRHLEMVKHPQFAAGVALVGASGLTCLQRHRSAIFPPIDFSIDAGDHFAQVGNVETLAENCPVVDNQSERLSADFEQQRATELSCFGLGTETT